MASNGVSMFLAWHELRRSPGRFALLTGAVALLVLLLLFFQAVAGALTSGLTGAFESFRGNVVVYDLRARGNPSASVLSPEIADAVAGLEAVADVAAVSLAVFPAQQDGTTIDVALLGGGATGPAAPARVGAGRLPEAAGEALASTSGFDTSLAVGDRLQIAGVPLAVVGSAPDATFSVLPTLYVSRETFQQVFAARTGTDAPAPVSFVVARTAEGLSAADAVAAIDQQVDGVEAFTRQDAVAALPGVGQITRSFTILYGLLYVVVAIVTGVFFLILTVQKRDALVLLRAVGAQRRDVVVPVLLQVVGVVGGGAVVGAAAAWGLLRAAQDTFGAGLDASTVVVSVAVVLVLGLVAATGAVRRVLRIDPIEATRPQEL